MQVKQIGNIGGEHNVRRGAVPHFGWWLAVVGLAALELRVFILFRAYHELVGGDGFAYSIQANLMARGHLFANAYSGAPDALHPPAWLVVLTLVALLGGHTWLPMQLASAAMGTGTVLMVGLAGRRIAGDRAGLVAAGIAAVYAGFWIYERALLSETLLLFEIAVMVILAYRFRERPSGWLAAVLGAMCGVLASTRSEQILILPFVVVPLIVSSKGIDWTRRIRWLAVGTVSMLAVLAPWTIYNLGRFQDPVILSTGAGNAAVVANCNPAYYGALTGFYDLSCLPSHPKGDPSTRETVERRIAITYAEHHLSRVPVVVFAREGRSFGFWDPFQQTALDHAQQGTATWVLDLGLIGLWVMVVPAIAGVVVLRRWRIPAYPLLAFIATVVVAVATSFGDTRYRAAAEVSMVLLTAVAIDAALPSRLLAPSNRATDDLPHGQGSPLFESHQDEAEAELVPAASSSPSTSMPRLPVLCLSLLALGAVLWIGVAKWTSTSQTRPAVSVIVPANGAKLRNGQALVAVTKDTSTVTRVEFYVTGGNLHDTPIGTAKDTLYGWRAGSDTSTVPDGSYALQAVAYDAAGKAIHSPVVSITIDH